MVSGERSISLKYNFKIPNHGSEFWASPSPSSVKGEGILNRHFMLQNYLRFYLYKK
jgi:hypothetical protein